MIDSASCLWNHRKDLVDSKEHLRQLYEAVNRPIDLRFTEWLKLYALVLEFSPDLIIELGRAYGNSTCVLTEAVNKSGKGKVVSIDYDGGKLWQNETLPRLQKLIDVQWRDKLTIVHEDIMKIDFTEITRQAQRILLFWDAHGLELAQYIIAHLFPLLQKKEHLIVMHDISWNTDPIAVPPSEYNVSMLIRINNLLSTYEEIIPAFSYISKNGIQYDTLAESEIRFLEENDKNSPEKSSELKNTWNELVDNSEGLGEKSDMMYFDINNKANNS